MRERVEVNIVEIDQYRRMAVDLAAIASPELEELLDAVIEALGLAVHGQPAAVAIAGALCAFVDALGDDDGAGGAGVSSSGGNVTAWWARLAVGLAGGAVAYVLVRLGRRLLDEA